MAVATFEVPRQRAYEAETPDPQENRRAPVWPKVGEWALLTLHETREVPEVIAGHRTGEKTYEEYDINFRGFVTLSPETTPSHAIGYNPDGTVRYSVARVPIYHLTQVHLIESDGDFTYEPYPDKILTACSENYTLDTFEHSAAS